MKQLFLIAIFSILSVSSVFVVTDAQSQSSQPAIESISVGAGEGGQEQLIFKLTASSPPKVFRLDGDRPRLVLDFADTIYRSKNNLIGGAGGRIIDGVRVGRHVQPPKIRVVVDILANVDYQYDQSFNVSDKTLIITFSPKPGDKPDKLAAAAPSPQYLKLESKKIVHHPQPPPAPASPPPEPPVAPTAPLKETSPALTATTPAPLQVKEQAPEPDPLPVAPIEEPPVAVAAPVPVPSIAAQQKKRVLPVEEKPGLATKTKPTQTQKPAPAAVEKEQPSADQQSIESIIGKAEDQADSTTSRQGTTEAQSAETITSSTVIEAEAPPVLLDVDFEQSINNSETVLFRLNNFFPPLVFGIEQGEPQVVCDFLDATLGPEVADSIKADGDYISRVEIVSYSDPVKVRVTLTLVPNRHYDLQQLFFKEDNLFVIIVSELQDAPGKRAD